MNPGAIYSKSGKGVQEASGKTSLLKRGDRAVLSAIDGRATLGEVATKVGKSFDPAFQQLIMQLDKDGFVREVTAVASSSQSRPAIAAKPSAPAAKAPTPAAKGPAPAIKAPAAKAPPPSSSSGDDLDFTTIMPVIKPGASRPAAPPPPPKPADASTQRAKVQESALYKAREEAEMRAHAERERIRVEVEAKARTETEAKVRAETEKKVREEAEARLKAEAEAKAKAARDAKIEIERKAREEVERRAKEETEKARREAEELRQRLDEERKAREAEERKRKEEEERRPKEEDERRAREEAERKVREEAERQLREEEEARARTKREEEEARARTQREEEEAQAALRAIEQDMARARKAQAETRTRQPSLEASPNPPPEPAAPPKGGAGSLDALMADLDSFSNREEEERQAREAADRATRDEKKRRARAESDRRSQEQAAQELRERERAAQEALRREDEERRVQEEAERRVREAEEQRRIDAEERKRRARESLAARQAPGGAPAAAAPFGDIGVTNEDLGMDDVRRDEAAVAKETRKREREREREARQLAREARERAQALQQRDEPVRYSKPRRPVKWGRPVAITLFLVLAVAVGLLHVMPLPMADYEAAASEALGRPVKVGTGKLSLFSGVRLNLEDVNIGNTVKIATVYAYPRIGSLIEDKKAFRRIELEGVTIPQHAIAETLSAKMRGDNFNVGRIVVKNLRLEGPVPLPAFEADAVLGRDGALRTVTLRGPDNLDAKLSPVGNGNVEFDVTASSITVPFASEVTLSSFAMKGVATRQGMNIAAWGGSVLDGAVSGTANVRWSSNWQVDGALTVRGINAAVFAPALLSEGKAEGTGRFSMSGADPTKLANAARIEGSFNVGKGSLGTVDLSRVLQTGGRQYAGRTQFTEMDGQGLYDRGAVALRNINITAGALHAAASADISSGGALSGRIVADIRTTVQPLRATLVLGGTVKEPQVRN
jgi:hypothetical protein